MKKYLFLLLFPLISLAQTANGTEDKKQAYRALNPQTVTTATHVVPMGTDGTMGKIDATLLPLTTATINAINTAATPDATTTVKGKVKLAGDLGGTADLPTTPTAVHKAGDTFTYSTDFDDVLSQNPSLDIRKRTIQPEATRLTTASTTILGWGDSLTAGSGGSGTTYETTLSGLTTFTVTNNGVGGETSTQIKTRMIADAANYDKSVIIWAGRNNYTDPTTVKADIATMVAALTHTRYLVVGILNGDYGGEYAGNIYHTQIVQLNADLKALYGKRYVEIREYLVSLHTNSAQDLIDFGHDIPPTSLRSDPIHLNAAGYTKVGEFLNRRLGILLEKEGYLQSKDFAYYNNLYNSGSNILNQSSVDQTANFRISGNGILGDGLITRKGLSGSHLTFQNGASSRWSFGLDGTESSTALGSNFRVTSYNNSGAVLNIPLYIFKNGHVIIKDTGSVPTDPNFNFTVFGSMWSNSLYLGTSPTASAGGYEFLTRNTSSGITEKIASANVATAASVALKENTITAGTTSQYWRGDKSWQTLDKTAVGLANVDNTTDANKPVSTATQTALNLKANLASPALTGTPTAPTATAGTNTTQVATTAFVANAINTDVNVQKLADSSIKTVSFTDGSYFLFFADAGVEKQFGVKTFKEDGSSSSLGIGSGEGTLSSFSSDGTVEGTFRTANGDAQIIYGGGTLLFPTSGSGTGSGTVSMPTLPTGEYKVSMQPKEYTVSELTTPVDDESRYAIVTDALAPTYLGVLVGGGSVVTPAFYNGTNWVAH